MTQIESGDAGLYRLCRVVLGHNDMYRAYSFSSDGRSGRVVFV